MSRADPLIDSHGRIIRDLRVSVTDRCNFRCLYCLPETEAAADFYQRRFSSPLPPTLIHHRWQPHANILTFEELERTVRLMVDHGIEKIRLTGGEPLLRQKIENLVERLARIPGLKDLAMTSNGFLFPAKARLLKEAGLRRVSFSLDSLNRESFRKITGRDGLEQVLESIRLAKELGMEPVKVNAVIIRGINDHELEALTEFARDQNLRFRFIEFMPLDSRRAWQQELVVTGREMLRRLQERFDLTPAAPAHAAETARRWAFPDGRGEIGIIAPVSEPFCGHCNRIRLTADGKIRTCLFSLNEHDLRARLRGGDSDEQIGGFLQATVLQKEARHHIGEPQFVQPERTMSCIGG
jgi:GTP 3',8-cyclase